MKKKLFCCLGSVLFMMSPVLMNAQWAAFVADSTAPYAHDLFIQGNLIVDNTVTGSYLYTSPLGIPEGLSKYRWYTADSIGAEWISIDSAFTVNYTIDSLDIGKYLVFEVTPVAISGDSVGEPATVYSDWPVGGVGMAEKAILSLKYFPNPASDLVFIESAERLLELSIAEMTGRMILPAQRLEQGRTPISLSGLKPGMYLLLFRTDDGRSGTRILVHQ